MQHFDKKGEYSRKLVVELEVNENEYLHCTTEQFGKFPIENKKEQE